MGRFLLIALMLTLGAAERQYFHQSNRATWEEARKHCQVCFKDLVTLTPENIQTIVKEASSESWVGLRKNFYSTSNTTSNSTSDYPVNATSYIASNATSNTTSNSTSDYPVNATSYIASNATSNTTSNSTSDYPVNATSYIASNATSNSTSKPSMPWSRWANGDPLSFQNWYPGWPVFKSSLPKRVCCSCSCTCPVTTTPRTTTSTTSTEFTTPDVTSSTGLGEHTTDNVKDVSSFTDATTGQNVTDVTGFSENATENMTDMSSFSDITIYENVTDVFRVAAFMIENMTDVSTSTDATTGQNMTDVTGVSEYATENMTDVSSFTDATTGQNVTDVTGVSEYATENMTDVSTSTDATTGQNVTDVTGFSEYATENMTDVSTSTDTTTSQNVTDVTGVSEYATENMTDVSSFTDATTGQNMTDVTGFSEYTTENMTTSTETIKISTKNTPVFTTTPPMTTSAPPIQAECVRSPMLTPDVPEADENYIEDSCVAMLGFGAWIEKDCYDLLSFICYEDRFFGQANVSDVTSNSANLTWLPGTGDISHYRVEVSGDKMLIDNQTGLSSDLGNLTAGTRYSVQVFPVKCVRDLSPQEVAFYTTPNKVENLTAANETETSISLSWDKPAGGVAFYLIKYENQETESKTAGTVVEGLTPGSLYTFTVLSGVGDGSKWSEESNVTKYTKPGKVSNLTVSSNTNTSLLLKWDPPKGSTTGFSVKAGPSSGNESFYEVVKQTEVNVTGLLTGSKITLSVRALINDTLEGDEVTTYSYTAPEPISNLIMSSASNNFLEARWNRPEGNYSSFTVELQLDGVKVNTSYNLTEVFVKFTGLKTAAGYTVIVYAVSGHLKSPPVKGIFFTLPSPPSHPTVINSGKHNMSFQWNAPVNTASVTYLAKISSSFWGHSFSANVTQTNHTFKGLNSGTRYKFEVRTVAGEKSSLPVDISHSTEADTRTISLSMLCSSALPLHCDNSSTKDSVFQKLKEHFQEKLGDNVFWTLEKQETG
uniref:serine-rich adhesin for platelets n=1 Tax=Semicossyphus pulcher TaxID=241346 RepID=UPI0037E74A51